MSLKRYTIVFYLIFFIQILIIFPFILNVMRIIVDLFFDFKWSFLIEIFVYPIFGVLMWLADFFEIKNLIMLIPISAIFLFITFYLNKLRNIYFILCYFIILYFIIFGRGIYYFIKDEYNGISSESIISEVLSIIICSFIFNSLLKKYLWQIK